MDIDNLSFTKTCTHCKQDLPLEAFYAAKHTKDKRLSWCKECTKAAAKASAAKKKAKETV
jgi:hypothetical protein